jgi:signal transduction histidine kinase
MRIGKHAFAFLVDQSGRTIVHPLFEPYRYDLSRYDDPLLREVVIDMILGETGWRTYRQIGIKAAAFAPVPSTGWSLAVSIPIEEFKKEAKAIGTRILQWVLGILILAGVGVALYSYQLLKPVRHLVAATERMASGDLTQEIPIHSRDEFGILTDSFNKMVRNLREIQTELIRSEKLISMGRLSAGVAHEVRNPLNAMKGAVALLQKSRTDDPLVLEYSQLILREITRLNKFVTEFLYFAKQSSPNRVATNVNEFLNNTLCLVEEEFKAKGVGLNTQFESSLPEIHLDPHQMEQVLLNIFFNAMHAMPDGGRLNVSTSLQDDDSLDTNRSKMIICIEDNGVGIPEEHLNSIFDPFFSTKETGTGLGLPISLGIVEGHDGKLEIVSREGVGTAVTIELPIEESPPFGDQK